MSVDRRSRLAAVAIVALALGAGAIVLQRWVAATRFDAILYVAVWFGLVGLAILLVAKKRRRLRGPLIGSYLAIAIVSGAFGYWWGFRDHEVHEDVVMASTSIRGAERVAALAPEQPTGTPSKTASPKAPPKPALIASGEIDGADGHSGTGLARIIRDGDGERLLTLTRFDVDPGAKVVVYLTPDPGEIGDRIELGDLKGNVGNQQYGLPADADLARYDTLVLYCTPFTVRIATAELG